MAHQHNPEFARSVEPDNHLILVDGDHELVCTVNSLQRSSLDAEPNHRPLTMVTVQPPSEEQPSIWRELLTRSFWSDLAVGL